LWNTCGIPRDILDKGLPISDNILYRSNSLRYDMISRASFGIVLSIEAILFTIWPHILPLQQHLAMAEIVPGSAPANTTGPPANTNLGAPTHAAHSAAHAANTTAGTPPANTTARAEAPNP
jgi:hypothetical protein